MSQQESQEVLERFWRNFRLRGTMLFDETGAVAADLYGQPRTDQPFGRGFVIGPDGVVELPLFGHDPDRVVATIRSLLGDSSGNVDSVPAGGRGGTLPVRERGYP